MKVYAAINAVQRELVKVGIAKDSRNSQGAGYNFRGIDAVYNTLSNIMANHGLCIIPRMTSRTCEERQSKNGGALFYVTVEAEFDLVSAEDGSKHTAKTYGEAMDSGDKATNKAMSAAYKYMAFQTFAIPTQGDNDADGHTHEILTPLEAYEKEHLEFWRNTAMEGEEALRAAFDAKPQDKLFLQFWQKHRDSFKEAAAK